MYAGMSNACDTSINIATEFKLKIPPPYSFEKRGWQCGCWGPQLHVSCHKTGESVLEILPINRNNIYDIRDIKVSINSNLDFTIWVFAWGLTHDHGIQKKYEKIVKHITYTF